MVLLCLHRGTFLYDEVAIGGDELGNKALKRKKGIVQEIFDNIEDSQVLILMDYQGLSVSEVTDLRSKYRESGVVYKVYKNTMTNFAFKDAGIEGFEDLLTGPNAIAFGMEDPVSAAKIAKDFAKEHEDLVIKAGYLDGKFLDAEAVNNLASLPSKEELVAKMLGSLNAPVQGFANVLTATLSSVVYALNAVKEKKEAEEA